MRGGQAVARTLFGEYNPGGKLSVTFPKSIGQIEYSFPYKPGAHGVQPNWSVNGGGITRVTGHLYPFGHGLSYTTFEYRDLSVKALADGWEVRCKVKNSGSRMGDEVVQLYIKDVMSSVTTYDMVLRGFDRITLKAGEEREVKFNVPFEEMSLWNREMQRVTEPGDFEFMVGSSSADIRLRETVRFR